MRRRSRRPADGTCRILLPHFGIAVLAQVLTLLGARQAVYLPGGVSVVSAFVVEEDDPESVRSLVERGRRSGRGPRERAGRRWTSAGSERSRSDAARIMARDWIDMPVERLEANAAGWFADHARGPADLPQTRSRRRAPDQLRMTMQPSGPSPVVDSREPVSLT
jgi:hypothetical protein